MSSVDYNMLISTLESTVVTEYVKEDMPVYTYQSEADLEREFIKNLQNQGYEYLIIHNEKELIANLKDKLEKLNNIIFSENEWERFFKEKIANKNESIIEKTRTIQEDYIKSFTRDNGTLVNISLIDKKNIHNNFLQAINQYEEENGNHNTRYDVSILVNGLPLIHIELKRRGVAIREAFNQINRYQRDSFWAGSGLFEYVQIFVISNGTNTKYYSNTTRARHIKEMSFNRKKVKKSSNSFEFTSYWADANNKAITDLVDFTKTFFAKHTILNILTLSAVPAFAGEWKQDDKGWWYQDDDGTYPRNTWRWIDGNHDGTAECYYFNDMGYILTSCPAPGGGSLNELGQWYKNKTVQTRTVKVFKEGEIGGDYINSQNKIELRWADKDADYAYSGKDFQRGKTEGYGINADFATDGKIFESEAGKLGYYVGLNHHLRDGGGKLVATGKEAKSSVYLDYVVGATYTTPSLAGFYGQLNVENEWEKHTAKTGYTNNFSLWTNLGYKAGIETPVGEVSINPFVKYRPVHKESVYNKHDENKRVTTEVNELRAGLGVGLTVK